MTNAITQRRRGGNCKKKSVQKTYIEDLVVDSVLSVLADEYIDEIAGKISDLSVKEGNTDTVKRLKRLLKENEEATANLIRRLSKAKRSMSYRRKLKNDSLRKQTLKRSLQKRR